MDEQRERVAMCALNRIYGYSPVTAHRIVDTLGSAAAFFDLDQAGRMDVTGPFPKYKAVVTDHEMEQSAEELMRLNARGCRFIAYFEPEFPELLKECYDAPMGLYLRSESPNSDIFGVRPQIAVVGTRDLSLYGKDWCRRLVGEMSCCKNPPMIVSGFAIGTDITAHRAALDCSLPTVAVLPTGIDSIYPQCHTRWVEMLTHREGCALVTDFPPDTTPKPITFLRRNRIIAGLSSATVLIESKRQGGGMITCELAFNYNREVYALPGRIDDSRSQGCNHLIRSNIATAIEDVPVFLSELGLNPGNRRSRRSIEDEIRKRMGYLPTEDLNLAISSALFIKANRGVTPEDLTIHCDCSFSKASYIAGLLQTESIIEMDLMQRCTIVLKNV